MDSSDKDRRTLSEALRTGKLGQEARSFLTGTALLPPPAQLPRLTQESPFVTPDPPLPPNPPPPPLHLNSMTMHSATHPAVVIPAIVSMTFRLPASLAAHLARVSAERKLGRQRPYHQQDIVAEALTQWLEQHGAID